MWTRLVPLALVLGLLLACGRAPDEALRAELSAMCEAPGPILPPEGITLVQVEGEPVAPRLANRVVVGSSELQIDGARVPLEELAEAMAERVAQARELEALTDHALQPALLFVDASVPAARLAGVLGALHSAGMHELQLVAQSSTPWPPPTYANEALAEHLIAELSDLPHAERRATLAARTAENVSWCPATANVFSAVAAASPEQRCALLAHGLSETLPRCWLTRKEEVLTFLQLMSAPQSETQPTAQTLQLDPTTEPLQVAPDLPLSELWPQLRSPLWLQPGAP